MAIKKTVRQNEINILIRLFYIRVCYNIKSWYLAAVFNKMNEGGDSLSNVCMQHLSYIGVDLL